MSKRKQNEAQDGSEANVQHLHLIQLKKVATENTGAIRVSVAQYSYGGIGSYFPFFNTISLNCTVIGGPACSCSARMPSLLALPVWLSVTSTVTWPLIF